MDCSCSRGQRRFENSSGRTGETRRAGRPQHVGLFLHRRTASPCAEAARYLRVAIRVCGRLRKMSALAISVAAGQSNRASRGSYRTCELTPCSLPQRRQRKFHRFGQPFPSLSLMRMGNVLDLSTTARCIQATLRKSGATKMGGFDCPCHLPIQGGARPRNCANQKRKSQSIGDRGVHYRAAAGSSVASGTLASSGPSSADLASGYDSVRSARHAGRLQDGIGYVEMDRPVVVGVGKAAAVFRGHLVGQMIVDAEAD